MATVSDLKYNLDTTVLRKSKYLVEITFDAQDTRRLSVLCQNVTFPERTVTKTTVHHKGRAYHLKGEITYGDSISLTFLDNTTNKVRRFFDEWIDRMEDITERKSADDPKAGSGLFSTIGKIKENGFFGSANKKALNKILDEEFPTTTPADATKKPLRMSGKPVKGGNVYQGKMEIWQLGSDQGKVYGYHVYNCFPITLSGSDFSADAIHSIQTLNVTMAYSEYEAGYKISGLDKAVREGLDDMYGAAKGAIEGHKWFPTMLTK